MAMGKAIQAVYEQGVFKPLQPVEYPEGQEVILNVEAPAMSLREAQAQVSQWASVYAGLSDEEVAEVESVALDRSQFVVDREGSL